MLEAVYPVTMGDSAAVHGLDHRELPFDLAPLELAVFRSAVQVNEPAIR